MDYNSFTPRINDSNDLPTPPAGGQEKSFAEQMNFLGLRPGGWAFNFWHLFRFSMCYPKGAHSWHHRWGNGSRNEGISIFQCATPRGLIRDTTVGALPHESMLLQFFNVLPQGGSFVTPSLGHFHPLLLVAVNVHNVPCCTNIDDGSSLHFLQMLRLETDKPACPL